MTSHELARALVVLSKVLRNGPNVPLDELNFSEPQPINASLKSNAPAALAMLVGLSNFKKSEWIDLIKELRLDVPIKPADSTRDLLGRLLKYLSENESVQHQLAEQATKTRSNVSPNLMNALSILLKK